MSEANKYAPSPAALDTRDTPVPPETNDRRSSTVSKPGVVLVVQIYVAWVAIGAGMRAVLSVLSTLRGGYTVAQGAGGFLVGAAIGAGAVCFWSEWRDKRYRDDWLPPSSGSCS